MQAAVRFQVPTATSMKMAVFWVVGPCSPVDVYRRIRGAYCFHHQGGGMMVVACTYEMWVNLTGLHGPTTQETAIFNASRISVMVYYFSFRKETHINRVGKTRISESKVIIIYDSTNCVKIPKTFLTWDSVASFCINLC
jgi:hypothetical protein